MRTCRRDEIRRLPQLPQDVKTSEGYGAEGLRRLVKSSVPMEKTITAQ